MRRATHYFAPQSLDQVFVENGEYLTVWLCPTTRYEGDKKQLELRVKSGKLQVFGDPNSVEFLPWEDWTP